MHASPTRLAPPLARLSARHALRYRPWLDANDGENVFFASVHGFGGIGDGDGMFYPSSGVSEGFDAHDASIDASAVGPTLEDGGSLAKGGSLSTDRLRNQPAPLADPVSGHVNAASPTIVNVGMVGC